MKPFRKLGAAAVTAAALGGISTAADAVIEGVLGEAGLVPFVYQGTLGSSTAPINVNTYVALKLPAFAGIDTIPNLYTAPHTTPNISQTPNNPNCIKNNGHSCDRIRWFFFDARSFKGPDGTISMSADDVEIFDWASVASGFTEIGYLVFTTEAGANGAAANFAFAIEAAMTFTEVANTWVLHIPALPMSDGADDGKPDPELGNEVVANLGNPAPANGIVTAVSPLAAGIRLANGGGDEQDVTRLDMTLGQRNTMDHLLVIWLDGNYDLTGSGRAIVNVWSEDEDHCSSSVPLPYELNLIWVEAYESGTATPPGQGLTDTRKDPLTAHLGTKIKHRDGLDRSQDDDTAGSVCIPAGKEARNLDGIQVGGPGGVGSTSSGFFPFEQRGIVQLSINEVHDITGLGRTVKGVPLGHPSSAGVAFVMYFNYDAIRYTNSPNGFVNGGGLDAGAGGLVRAASEHAVDLGKQDRGSAGE